LFYQSARFIGSIRGDRDPRAPYRDIKKRGGIFMFHFGVDAGPFELRANDLSLGEIKGSKYNHTIHTHRLYVRAEPERNPFP
jgi:hypothetical protein